MTLVFRARICNRGQQTADKGADAFRHISKRDRTFDLRNYCRADHGRIGIFPNLFDLAAGRNTKTDRNRKIRYRSRTTDEFLCRRTRLRTRTGHTGA